MKKFIAIIAVLCVSLMGLNAQKWHLLHPVTADMVKVEPGAKAGSGVWIPRLNAGLSFIAMTPTFDELDQFNGFASQPLSKLSIGMTYAHYLESEGKAVSNYSVSGLLLLPTTGETSVAVGVTGSLYNISAGFGYNLVKGPFDHNWFILFGVQFLL